MNNKDEKIVNLLKYYGFDSWICGGTARDLALNKNPESWDVAVKASLEDLIKKLESRVTFVNDFSTYITVKYYDQEFNLYPLKKIFLINTYYNYEYTTSLEEDSKSRDFTINSFYWNPLKKEFIDPQNGLEDLKNKKIKFTGNDFNLKILESKVRLLRAAVLNSVLGEDWVIEENTKQAIKDNNFRIVTVNTRQLNNEMIKLFTRSKKISFPFKLLDELNLLKYILPELLDSKNIPQPNKNKNLDLYDHILLSADAVPYNHPEKLLLRVSALLHDIGKPYTKTFLNNELHFYNHEYVGAYLSEKILNRWGFFRNFFDKVSFLIQNHLFDSNPNKTDQQLKKFIAKIGIDNVLNLIDLRIADRTGSGRINISMDSIYKFKDRINELIAKEDITKMLLNIEDSSIINELKIYNDYSPESLNACKMYLKNKVINDNLKNNPEDLKQEIHFVAATKCPLGKEHLFSTWNDITIDNADTFSNGTLKCGIYCGNLCVNK